MGTKSKLSGKIWLTAILFGLFGQIAWIVENMYFNVFIDRTMSTNAFAVAIMVAASAIVATAATLIGGTWSDKIGQRRKFMSYGYILWGLVVMSFSLITVKNAQSVFGVDKNTAITIAITVVVVMDCIMTYIGSTANDSAFNAWITDNTESSNRGIMEGVLAIMPLVGMAAVFGGLDWMTQDTYQNPATLEIKKGWASGWVKTGVGDWTTFFLILGGLVMIVGIIGIFTIKDSPNLVPSKTASFKDMLYGFKPESMKSNKNLYYTYITMAIIGIANNSYMAYLIMYLERTLGFSNYIIPVGIIIVTAAIGSVIFGTIMDKSKDRRVFLLPLVVVYIFGALAMYIASPLFFTNSVPLIAVCIAGFILMGGNLCMSAALTATVRDLTPPDKVGLFQGVRMFFWVLIPMCIGPMLTAFINIDSPIIAQDIANGIEIREYTPYMFLLAACIGTLSVLPILKLNQAKIKEMHPFENDDLDNIVIDKLEIK